MTAQTNLKRALLTACLCFTLADIAACGRDDDGDGKKRGQGESGDSKDAKGDGKGSPDEGAKAAGDGSSRRAKDGEVVSQSAYRSSSTINGRVDHAYMLFLVRLNEGKAEIVKVEIKRPSDASPQDIKAVVSGQTTITSGILAEKDIASFNLGDRSDENTQELVKNLAAQTGSGFFMLENVPENLFTEEYEIVAHVKKENGEIVTVAY